MVFCSGSQKEDGQLQIRGGVVARNTIINLIGQALPLIVGVIAVPFVLRGLGQEGYGLLSIAWVILGYFSIFDLGLGRATTKYVAEALGKGEEEYLPPIIWTAVMVQLVLGVIGALVLAAITPLLVENILKINLELQNEARVVFYLLTISVPVVLVSGSFRGVLEAAQRFELVNAVKVPSSTLVFLIPLICVFSGLGLAEIIVLILVARVGALLIFAYLVFRIFPGLRRFSGSFAFLPRLMVYGGWVTVSGIISPVLVNLDRFIIGSLISLSAVAYYSVPYEAVTRILIVPVSVSTVLFPAFSVLEGAKDRQRLGILFARSLKYILLASGLMALTVIVFAGEILRLWLGADYAVESTGVLQILALGVVFNSLAHIPFALLQGIGRPELPAKFHLLELPVYIALAWILVSRWGITGAALSWTFRVLLDAVLLFGATFKVYGFSMKKIFSIGLPCSKC